jgi:hypothetical protein
MSVFFSQEFPGSIQSMEKTAVGSTRIDSTRLFSAGVVQIPELGATLRAKSEFVEQSLQMGMSGIAANSVQLTPAMLEAAAGAIPRTAASSDVAVMSAATLAGKYHAWRIKSSFPVPGSMMVDDYRRRYLAMYASTQEKVLAPVRKERELRAEAKVAVLDRLDAHRLPTTVERLLSQLENVVTEKDDAVGANAIAQLRVPASGADLELFKLIEDRKILEIEERFQRGEVNVLAVCPRTGATGLMKAVTLGILTVMRLYLRAGADSSFTLPRGISCLHCVYDSLFRIKKTHPQRRIKYLVCRDMLTSLLEFGADANKATPNGLTALHMAGSFLQRLCALRYGQQMPPRTHAFSLRLLLPSPAAFGYDDICSILLRHGADRKMRDRKNRTPQQVAEAKGQKNAAQLIANWGYIERAYRHDEWKTEWSKVLRANAAAAREDLEAHGRSGARGATGFTGPAVRSDGNDPAARARAALWGLPSNPADRALADTEAMLDGMRNRAFCS